MQLLMPLVALILSIFAICVMSYVALATAIGPWIDPTLVLCATILIRFIFRQTTASSNNIALAVIASSTGGILATALGFSFPTLYFLDPITFKAWMRDPLYFSLVVSSLCLAGGLFGFWIANVIERKLLIEQRLLFPVGFLVSRMIAAQNQVQKAKELGVGLMVTFAFCALQKFTILIPKFIILLRSFSIGLFTIPQLRFDLMPLSWAVGFVTGHVVAIPLLVGAVTKLVVTDFLGAQFFPHVSTEAFTLAFCSGMVLVSTVMSVIKAPISLWQNLVARFTRKDLLVDRNLEQELLGNINFNRFKFPSVILVFLITCGFLTYFKFSFMAQIYLLVLGFIATYQIANIAGKIGLAYLGRFATFVMVPALFLFDLNRVQITMLCTFVEISGGVAADILFGRKIAQLNNLSSSKVRAYQLYGLIISCLIAGIIFWALGHQFRFGSLELFAQRAQARALLINIGSFNTVVMLLGVLFGGILHYFDRNPMIVLGGLLMPLSMSLGIITGGLFARFTKNQEQWFPFWSGVFAAQSLWMALSALL